MRVRDLGIQRFDILISGVLLGAAELAVAVGAPAGPTFALYLFPLGWTLPFLVRRRFPSVVALTVLAALALESFVAQQATESLVALVAVVLAFWTAGTVPDRGRALVVGIAGVLLGLVIVAKNPGPLPASDVVFVAIVSTLPFVAGMVLRSRKRHTEDLRRRAAALEREREERARAAVEEERARIARELHDIVGHAVGVMTVQAGAARLLLDQDPRQARQSLLAIEEAGRQALGEMRRLLAVLRSDGAAHELDPQPGLSDLAELVAQARAPGLAIELVVEGDRTHLSPGLDLTAYRIVQEALTNVRKYAGNAAVVVRVRYDPESVTLEVEDDGTPPAAEVQDGGHGLIGMRERVALYGGELVAGPRPGGGFAVHACLPLGSGAS